MSSQLITLPVRWPKVPRGHTVDDWHIPSDHILCIRAHDENPQWAHAAIPHCSLLDVLLPVEDVIALYNQAVGTAPAQ